MESRLGELLTERNNPASNSIDTLPVEEMLDVINREDQTVARAVAAVIPEIARAVELVSAAFESGGRLFYIGAGTSGRLGVLDAAECSPTFGVPPSLVQGIIAGGNEALSQATEGSEDDPDAGSRDLLARGFQPRDVLTGIAASGRTPYVLGAVRQARERGARTIGISCTPDSELARAVDIAVTPLTGPEVIAGSTRLKAGTATKLVLNMISTGAMIQSGYVYGNLMVNVQPRNAKLLERAVRIVRDAARISEAEAEHFLRGSGNVPATAIVMARGGLDREDANRLLANSGGRLGNALQRLGPEREIGK